MKTCLVTGTDTGVGKTWISSLLIRQMLLTGLRVGAYKPVCSGAELDESGHPFWADVEALRVSCGNQPPIDRVCPQRFQAAVAPNVAAELEGREVDDQLLLGGIEPWRNKVDWLIVEGAGGVFCPLSNRTTVLDLAIALHSPVVVVAANRLGVINHTRLTVESLQLKGIEVVAVVLNEIFAPTGSVADPSRSMNARQLRQWLPELPLFQCAWMAEQLTASSPGVSLVDRLLR